MLFRSPSAYRLVIYRSDGSEEVIILRNPPVLCGNRDEDTFYLCGYQVTGDTDVAVDFIPINEGLGETYEVIEQ